MNRVDLPAPAVAVCTEFFDSIDLRDWAAFENCLSAEVVTDFTALWGGEPERTSAADLTRSWRALFAGFRSTQHLVTGYRIVHDEPGHPLTLRAAFRATHLGHDPFGSSEWTLYGTYRIGLSAPDGNGVRVRALYQQPTFGTGNRNVVLRALAAAQ